MAMSGDQVQRLRTSIAATAGAIALLLGIIGYHAYPSTEAVRLRNALLINPAGLNDPAWQADKMPARFIHEERAVPPPIAAAARRVTGSAATEFEQARALTAHLLANIDDSGPTLEPRIERKYRAIADDGRGYCADLIDAFVALALAKGIPVRTWAFSFDRFGGHGHIVAEVRDRALNQWVMLDVFNNVYPADAAGHPLSALEFHDAFLRDPNAVRFERIGQGRVAYWDEGSLRRYYHDGIEHWYFWNGNNVVSRSESWPYPLLDVVPAAAQLAAVALGDFPQVLPLATERNRADIEAMTRLGERFRVALALLVLLGVALILQAALLIRRRYQSRRRPRPAPLSSRPVSPIEDRHA